MKYHKQLHRHDPANGIYGDCGRTVIACLLDIDPEDVPHEHREMTGAEHNAIYDTFLKERGVTRLWVGLSTESVGEAIDFATQWSNGMPFTLMGMSPRGTNHVVIGCQGEIIHDPHPDGGGIVGPSDNGCYYIEWLVRPAGEAKVPGDAVD